MRRGRAIAAAWHTRPRPLVTALLAIAIASGAAGCHNPASSGAAPGPAKWSVTVAAVPGIDNAPLQLAYQAHLFAQAGLKIRILHRNSGSQALAAVQAGDADIAAVDYGQLFFAEAHLAEAAHPLFRIVADGYDAQPGVLEIVTLPGSGITRPKQLTGQQIGAPDDLRVQSEQGTPNSLATAAATSVLQSYGVNVTTVAWHLMPPADEITALGNHQVKAILVAEPYLYQAQAQLGAVQVLDAFSGATADLPMSGYVATSAWSLRHTGAITAFRDGLVQAQARASEPGPVQQTLTSGWTGSASPAAHKAALLTFGSFPTTTNPPVLQRVATLLELEGTISRPVNATAMIAPSRAASR
jgi:NitT/TauT family transport system substrate-binding protein